MSLYLADAIIFVNTTEVLIGRWLGERGGIPELQRGEGKKREKKQKKANKIIKQLPTEQEEANPIQMGWKKENNPYFKSLPETQKTSRKHIKTSDGAPSRMPQTLHLSR